MYDLSQFNHQITGSENSPKKLVFLHGLLGYGANWRKIARAFEQDYQVLVYDQRGHGRSIRPESGYAPENFTEDLKMILNQLGWQRIYLVGHSMGGRNAVNFTYQHPGRVKRLVIEDIGPDAGPEPVQRMKELLYGVPVPFASRVAAKEFFYNDFVKKFSDRPQVGLLGQFLYSNLQEIESDDGSGGKMDWRFDREVMLECVRQGRARDRWQEFDALKVPSLLIRGENSGELSREVYEQVLQRNSHIHGVEIAHSGHWVHYDQPERFIEEVARFIL